jgi:uncharacterized protein
MFSILAGRIVQRKASPRARSLDPGAPLVSGPAGRLDAVLVCGGQGHDVDLVRHELLGELLEHEHVRTTVHADHRDLEALERADLLITYTCNVRPDAEQQAALVRFLERGGRWLALHATNATLEETSTPGVYHAPDVLGDVKEVLGGRFVAHPPITEFDVQVTAPDHPLVAGLEPFEARDELYVVEVSPPIEVLLHTTFGGRCEQFEPADFETADHPVLYLKRTGQGTVCYLTLGHSCGRHDMQVVDVDDLGFQERGSWDLPAFRTLLRRCIRWAVTDGF